MRIRTEAPPLTSSRLFVCLFVVVVLDVYSGLFLVWRHVRFTFILRREKVRRHFFFFLALAAAQSFRF